MKLGGKIMLGFLVVLALHVAVAVMAYVGQRRAERGLSQLDGANQLTRRMLEIDRLVGKLQSNVQGYTFSGNRGLALRGERTHQALRGKLESLRRYAPAEEQDHLLQMQTSLLSYAENFQAAVGDRLHREQLVQHALPELSTRSERLFSVAASQAPADVFELQDVMADLLRVQNGAHQYLAQLDSPAMARARTALAAAQRKIERARQRRWIGDVIAAQLVALCEDFDQTLLGLVQTTRGYLHLVHVVIAAEAEEFLRLSAAMRERALARVEHLQTSIGDAQHRYELWSVVVSLATIVLGILAGAIIRGSVVRPLEAIASTIRRLTNGERVQIPGLERRDEVGQMANAAKLLRDHSNALQELSIQREQVIEDLQQSNRDLDSFAHIASHDLKAPLRAINSLVRWLEEDCGDALSPVGHECLEHLAVRVARMDTLLRDLDDYARAGRLQDDFEVVDIRALIGEAVDFLDADSFAVRILGGEDLRLRTSPVPLAQVLRNLLSNAISHHDGAAGSIDIEVSRQIDAVRIAITDDGPGIPAKFHERVFRPFETLRPREGTTNSGVGLAIVAKLCRRYCAMVHVESPVDQGRGTRFVVVWPDGQRQRLESGEGAVPLDGLADSVGI